MDGGERTNLFQAVQGKANAFEFFHDLETLAVLNFNADPVLRGSTEGSDTVSMQWDRGRSRREEKYGEPNPRREVVSHGGVVRSYDRLSEAQAQDEGERKAVYGSEAKSQRLLSGKRKKRDGVPRKVAPN